MRYTGLLLGRKQPTNFFFFFCVPQLHLWGSPFWGEIFAVCDRFLIQSLRLSHSVFVDFSELEKGFTRAGFHFFFSRTGGARLYRGMAWSGGRGHDALVTDLLTFVGLLKFSARNSEVMSSSLGGFVRKCVSNFTPSSPRS